jgi:hypothetical protein
MRIIQWVKNKLGISRLECDIKAINAQQRELHKFIDNRLQEMNELTRVDADVGYRGNNTIILTGVFRNKAYVRFYDMGDGEFERLVLQIHDMQKHSLIRHVDKPYDFHGTFNL